jgi:hypothetical protein
MKKQVIQMNPVSYSFILEAISDKKRRRCYKKALEKYNKTCATALKRLIRDVEKCKLGDHAPQS